MMKKQAALLILLFALTTTLPSALAYKAVFDAEGNIVRQGEKYYMMPRLFGVAGGLTLGRVDNASCAVTVVHEDIFSNDVSGGNHTYGVPVKINIAKPSRHTHYVLTEFDLEIEFVARHECCASSTKWAAYSVYSPGTGSVERVTVGVGGYEDHSGDDVRVLHSGSLRMEEYEPGVYKLLLCFHEADPHSCFNIKRVDDHRGMRLDAIDSATTDPHFQLFVFVKADAVDQAHSAARSTSSIK